MKVVTVTKKLFQSSGTLVPISPGKYTLVTATLTRSCPLCRIDPTNANTRIYKGDRDLKKIVVSKLEANTDDAEQDIHGLAKIIVAALKDGFAA